MIPRHHVVERLTNGILNSSIDLLLFQIALVGASVGKRRSPQDVHKMFNEAFSFLEEINHHTVRSAWQRLRRQGLISVVEDRLYYRPVITAFGKKRLRHVVPTYQKVRPWDKRIYLVTYDIPESRRKDRDVFRSFLRDLDAAMLQISVWLTPYNPQALIEEFIRERDMGGTIIVSDTGTNGAVGKESITDLVVRVYNLERINAQYEEFLASYKKLAPQQAIFSYLAILADDPQLPFELHPLWWEGDKAYKTYQALCQKLKKSKSPAQDT